MLGWEMFAGWHTHMTLFLSNGAVAEQRVFDWFRGNLFDCPASNILHTNFKKCFRQMGASVDYYRYSSKM